MAESKPENSPRTGVILEATAGAFGIVAGLSISFVGATQEAAQRFTVWGGMSEVAHDPSRTGKELIITGGVLALAGMTSWFRAIRNWQ